MCLCWFEHQVDFLEGINNMEIPRPKPKGGRIPCTPQRRGVNPSGPVERLTPGEKHPDYLVQEHINRYLFASQRISGKIVADLGSGSGYGSSILVRKGAKHVIAADSSISALRFAVQHYRHPNIDYVLADTTWLPFKKKSFDIAISFEIVEHLTKPIDFVVGCQRILRPSGTLMISSPNKQVFSPKTVMPDNPYHIHEFFISDLESLLTGFFGAVSLYGQTSEESLPEQEERDSNLGTMPYDIRTYRSDPKYEPHPHPSRSDRIIIGVCKLPKKGIPVLGDLETKLNLIHFRELSTILETRLKAKSKETPPDPMSMLLDLYYARKDLQEAFPEVMSGKYDSLLNWAKATVTDKKDESHHTLAPFEYWYETNPLVELASKEQQIKELQKDCSNLRDNVMRLTSELDLKGNGIKELEAERSASERQLTQLREELNLRNNRIKELEGFLSGEFVICTIAAKNYLAHVRVLTDSFLKYHPEAKVFVLLADEVDQYFDPSTERFQTVSLQEIGVDGLRAFLFKYGILEVSTAVKPFFLEYLFRRYGLRKLVYLDPDILVTNSLAPLSEMLEKHSIILTPHLLDPIDDDLKPSELDIVRAGTYNLGFIALKNNETTESFLSWWKKRLYDHCVMAPSEGLHVDQKWVELALGFFEDILVLRDPGYNVAYWNMGGRRLTVKNGRYFVNGELLRFFHFSGFDPDSMDQISRHQNRFTLKSVPAYETLFETYRDLLYSEGARQAREWPWKYDYFDNGVRIPGIARKVYRESKELQQECPNPFLTREPDNYFRWLNSSVESLEKRPCITRLWYEAYKLRKDVQEAYPDILGLDRGGFIGWVVNTGWKEHNTDKSFVPEEYFSISSLPAKGYKSQPATPKGRLIKCQSALRELGLILTRSLQVIRDEGVRSFLRQVSMKIKKQEFKIIRVTVDVREQYFESRDSESIQRTSPERKVSEPLNSTLEGPAGHKLRFGVNLAGYFTGQFGNATSSRAFAQALKLAGIPQALNKLVGKIHGERHSQAYVFSNDNPYAINLIHVNADMAENFFRTNGRRYFQGRYNIGIWYWELSRFPARWLSAFGLYDEIWVMSSFVAECLSKVSPIPIVKMRYPLSVNTDLVQQNSRDKFGIENDSYVFFFSFDFLSVFERKNPLALLKAFRSAFDSNEKTTLVIHHINSAVNPVASETLEKEARDRGVKMLKGHLSEQDYLSLLAACDCYVSLHRSEGLGLTMAEAMYLGKPVIATGYSGNMDFMNVNNSLLVKHDLVELDRNYGPYEKGSIWADPDIDHAAQLMRWVYENREVAKSLGGKASMDVRRYMSPAIASEKIKRRLEQVYRSGEKLRWVETTRDE